MKILIIGNGGREAAIAWKLKDDKRITKMYFAKGNATTETLGETINETEIEDLVKFALKSEIDLTIVGPEAALVDGVVDEFSKNQLKIFGPQKKTAALEGSKAFSKKFMQDYGIKTAASETFSSYEDAVSYAKKQTYPLVIKASGLANGKGVVISENKENALAALHDFMMSKIHGEAGNQVVVEDYLEGFEASIIAFSNGEKLFPCIPVKDYKKSETGDKGPNTGGMGTVAPNPDFTDEHMQDFIQNIMNPTMKGLTKENLKFTGFIFFGLMVCKGKCYLLEYNMRLGDPETQVILPLLENNLLDVMLDCIEGKDIKLKFKNQKAVCLVVVSDGYPGQYEVGFEINGMEKVEHSDVLLAGAKYEGKNIVTNGGRVLNIIALGNTYEEARKKVYTDAKKVSFRHNRYRQDIGKID